VKIHGLFLRSRAGRRIFWTLMVAAAVPIGLFGWLIRDALGEHFAAQAQKQRVQAAKFAGLSVLDNLLVARTVLEVVAGQGSIETPKATDARRGQVLRAVAIIDDRGRYEAGERALWERWSERLIGAEPANGRPAAGLLLGAASDGSGAPVLIMLPPRGASGSRWIAEVETRFLFGELRPDVAAQRICVFAMHGQDIYCPRPQLADPESAATADAVTQPARWGLFLRSDFGVDDWLFVNLDRAADGALESIALTRTAGLGVLATLLLVVMLGMVQVRRTMVPLERLIAGTRRLSRRDFSARVQHDSADEFGELAQSFNHMAARLGQQVEAFEVHSAIDHGILNGLDVPDILQRVVGRIAQLVPGAKVIVVEVDRSTRALSRVHRAGGAFALVSLPPAETMCADLGPGEELKRGDALPPALVQSMDWGTARLHVRPVRMDGSLVGLIVIGIEGEHLPGVDALREIDELGMRVAVALTAADRERRLLERATHDSLTGLANRSGMLDALERAIRSSVPLSLLFIDLDRFKEINDTMGHQAGDELLREMARRLSAAVPAQALVARPGGDEFVVLMPGPRAEAQALAETIVQLLSEPTTILNRSVAVAASIGLAHHPEDGQSATDMLRRADMAMYSAKARGGHCAAWFDAQMDVRLSERSEILADLRHALERGEFELHYQPRQRVQSADVRSAEALLRWRHPNRGLVPPGRFIQLLEETGLIGPVGAWAIETACRQVATWRARNLSLRTVAVNVSTRQLHDPLFVEQLAATLQRTGIPPDALEIEVTESIFVGDSGAAIATLRAASRLGVKIALDDFGTGYSSLSYLQRLPIGILKVDRSFVVELATRTTAMAVTRSIVALARALDMQVVAEGVETLEQAQRLSELGCDELQGYLVARPMPAGEIPDFLSRQPVVATV
jgi:diguanylate cyclase (GGDEF)-like protein